MGRKLWGGQVSIFYTLREKHQVFVCGVRGLERILQGRSAEGLRPPGGAGGGGLVVAAVHLLLHGAVLLQLLARVVGDLQEAAGLHHHVGLAGVWQDGELRDHLRGAEGQRSEQTKQCVMRWG